MEWLQAITLGTVQGLTEFLPISSSGHLVIFQHIFGFREAELLFDISVHLGTLIAVIIFLRKEVTSILASLANGFSVMFSGDPRQRQAIRKDPDLRLAFLVIVGSIPTAIIGLMFKQIAETLFSTILIVGVNLIITGCLLWLTRRFRSKGRSVDRLSFRDALVIGTVQGIAILPGISRSGSTISTGIFLGVNHELSARFSFLLSIPAVLGATLLSFRDFIGIDGAIWQVWLSGMIASGIVGYLALKILVYIVRNGNLFSFAPYCWLTGTIAVWWAITST